MDFFSYHTKHKLPEVATENLVASTQFLVQLATSELQFQALIFTQIFKVAIRGMTLNATAKDRWKNR